MPGGSPTRSAARSVPDMSRGHTGPADVRAGRLARRTAIVLTALVGVALATLPAGASAPAATGSDASASHLAAPVRSPALEDVGACMLQRRRGDVLLLVDASPSLRTTDPN